MTVVDTHCHAGESWFEPVELLLYQMDANRVEKGVLIQHKGAFDNTYLLECQTRYPGRFAVAVMVDPSRDDAADKLRELAEAGASAVRLEPNEPANLWRTASELGLIVSCQSHVTETASDEFRSLLEGLPDLTVVLEHLAGSKGDEEPPYPLFRRAMGLAQLPHTYLKVPGLGEITSRPPVLAREFQPEKAPRLIEIALDAFGPQRMMWGSDYPPVSNREGYRNALQGIKDYPALVDGEDREWVLGKTALRVFRFE